MRTNKSRKLIVVFLFTLTFVQPSYAFSTHYAAAAVAGIGIIGAMIVSALHHDDNDETPAVEEKIEAGSVFFSEPGIQNLVLTNTSTKNPVTVSNIVLNSGVHGVTVGSFASCQPIPAGGTCSIPLTATQDAYGSGAATITYGSGKQITASVGVASVTLELYEIKEENSETLITSGEDIILKIKEIADVTQTFKYKNVGKFSWQQRGTDSKIDWHTTFDPEGGNTEYYVSLDKDTCGNSGSVVPTEYCTFKLTTKNNHPGDWGIVKAAGLNLGGDQLKNALAGGGLEIAINTNPADNHLGYRSIKITNTMPKGAGGEGDMWIKKITPEGTLIDGTDPVVKYCAPDASSTECHYKTTCNIIPGETPQTSLPPESPEKSCLVWFKALSKKTDGTTDIELQTKPSISNNIKVTVAGQKKMQGGGWSDFSAYEKDCNFTAAYDNALYVGGVFTSAGGIQGTNSIAKWNGSSWATLGSGIGGGVGIFALTSINNDLYVGGYFTSAGGISANNIAKWDGSSWGALGSGIGGYVLALTSMDDKLCVGGVFSSAGGTPANSIAEWDGSNWSSLGTGVTGGDAAIYALTSIGDDLYVGGYFTSAGGIQGTNAIAKWNVSNWGALSSGIGEGGGVFALTSMNNKLYAGGTFVSAGGTPANSIAEWDGSNWRAFGSEVAEVVRASFTSKNSNIYVGGLFHFVEGVSDCLAKWNGSSWSSLGMTGDEIDVRALAGINNDLYVGGSFYSVGGISVINIAKLDESTSTWSSLGDGVNGIVYALLVAPSLTIDGYLWPSGNP